MEILQFLRDIADKVELDAVILPCSFTPKDTMPIVSAKDLPKYIVTWKEKYVEIDPKAYYHLQRKIQDGQRMLHNGIQSGGKGVHFKCG